VASVIIVIPCYNEEKRLDRAGFLGFTHPSHAIKFLFVNDGSTDNTLQVLESLRLAITDKFSVLSLLRNQGKAEAVRQGIMAALKSKPDYVGFWDADLATPLDTIPEFIEFAESRPELSMVFAARVKLLGRTIQRRSSRHYLGRVFATAASTVLGMGVYDTQCGAKLFRATPLLNDLFEQRFQSRWIFDVEILARFITITRDRHMAPPDRLIYEFPLSQWKDIAGTKVRFCDFIRAAWELYLIHRKYFSSPRS
jgi:glycosyltransferase involved in cell wall biosynthesis